MNIITHLLATIGFLTLLTAIVLPIWYWIDNECWRKRKSRIYDSYQDDVNLSEMQSRNRNSQH